MCKIKKIRPKAPDIASLFAQNRYLYVPIGNPPNRRTRNPAPQPDRRQPIREGTPPIGGPKGAGNPDKRPCDQRSFPTETCCARAEFSFSSTPMTRIFQPTHTFGNHEITAACIFLSLKKTENCAGKFGNRKICITFATAIKNKRCVSSAG